MIRPYALKVFIASPGDVVKERDIIEASCNKWTRTHGTTRNVVLQPIRWESDLPATSHVVPQDLINKELLEDCDILIALLWSRAGTATQSYPSGTFEEIARFIRSKKPVLLYFYGKPVNPLNIDANQLKTVQTLKDQYKTSLIYKTVAIKSELESALEQDLTYNVTKLIQRFEEESKPRIQPASEQVRQSWLFEVSISELIAEYLHKNNADYITYNRSITFHENCELWRNSATNYEAIKDLAKKAREHAFGIKYGEYNYDRDLRSNSKEMWFNPVQRLLAKLASRKMRVIGVGSNNGLELKEIFQNSMDVDIEVLDISERAVDLGKRIHGNFKFHVGDMESCPVGNATYDVYLNLRAVHSSGVDMRTAVSECYRVLKYGGVAIFSISNGYLLPRIPGSDEMFAYDGMYDTRTESFSKIRPYYLANRLREKLEDYKFARTGMETGETEIFVWGWQTRS